MSESSDAFFEGKRPWSKIKDEVLEKYMKPYLAKVNTRGQRILLIDGYAGPGIFDDGSRGSPIIMCEKAEERARGNYQAIFVNKERKHHNKLSSEILRRGWSQSAEALLGYTQEILPRVARTLKDQTVFLYLDPFGPTGCNFDLLSPFLNRNPKFSTEILFTMNMPGIPRLAALHANEEGREDVQIQAIRENRQKLTKVFGGEYWKEILLQNSDGEKWELQLIEAYQAKLAAFLPFTRFCPVREGTGKHIKYFIVFASRHEDALVLMNDIMTKAYFAGMHTADFSGGLWADMDWREMRSTSELPTIIQDTVAKHPGESRKKIWFHIVNEHFMRYLESEYNNTVKKLVETKKIISPTFNSTKRLNENSALYPPQP